MSEGNLQHLHDADAERHLIGAMLSDKGARIGLSADLSSEDFYLDANRRVFVAIRAAGEEAAGASGYINPRNLNLDAEALSYAQRLSASVPSVVGWKEAAKEVSELARARKLSAVLEDGQSHLTSEAHKPLEVMGHVSSAIERLMSGGIGEGAKPLASASESVMERARQLVRARGIVGVRSGIGFMDRKLGGFQPGRNYLLGARSGHGKSTLAGTVALNAARTGARVLVQSTEMPADQYLERLARADAGITEVAWEKGALTDSDLARLSHSLERVGRLDIFVDDYAGATPDMLRRNILRTRPALVVIDYLQRMTLPRDLRGRSEYEDVSRLSLEVDRLKSAYNIPLLTVVQLNRAAESRHGNRPAMSDLRGSGQLEQDADVILLMHRPSKYSDDEESDLAKLECHKNRHGEDGWLVNLWKPHGLSYLTDQKGSGVMSA